MRFSFLSLSSSSRSLLYCRYLSSLSSSPPSSSTSVAFDYASTLNLLQTTFPSHWNPSEREPELLARTTHDLYAAQSALSASASAEQTQRERFRLHDGPPFANGRLHCGHFLNKVLKDIINRYQLLHQGRCIEYRPGWDCHGLPIELKALELIKSQKQTKEESQIVITEMTPMQIRICARNFAQQAMTEQKREFVRFGVLADWDNPYETMSREYEATQVGVFAAMVRKGYIHRGLKPVSWSPSSKTALAEAELEYNDDHISPSVHVLFQVNSFSDRAQMAGIAWPVNEGQREHVYALVWTTTPWTIPSNQAIAIHPSLKYSLVRVGSIIPLKAGEKPAKQEERLLEGLYLIIGHDRVCAISALIKREITVLATVSGTDLLGTVCKHPYYERISPFILGEHVTTESGTALVHTAPAHGVDDFIAARAAGINECLLLTDDSGCFNEQAGSDLQGLFVLGDGNEVCINKLRRSQSLFHFTRFRHRYPYDWRSKTPVIERATWQWFAKLDSLQELALQAIEQVNFVPAAGRQRLIATISSRTEWCLSRQRVWGVPLPVFYDAETNEAILSEESIAHVQSLFAEHGSDIWYSAPIDTLLAASLRATGRSYVRGTDTLDVWFDSGSSWALQPEVHAYDVYLEGNDQHRGWFQSSLLTSLAVREKAPYRAVVTHGFVLDEQHRKMSKSIGNVIEPRSLIDVPPAASTPDLETSRAITTPLSKRAQKRADAHKINSDVVGADVLRLWAASVDYRSDASIGPGILNKVKEMHRKLRTTFRFLLSNLSDCTLSDLVHVSQMNTVDAAMIYSLHQLNTQLQQQFERFEFSAVHSSLISFVTHELSAYYFDIRKDCLYVDAARSHSRRSCQTVLAYSLEVLLKSIAPFIPFTAEDVWSHLQINQRYLIAHSSKVEVGSLFLVNPIRKLLSDSTVDLDYVVRSHSLVEMAKSIKGHVMPLLEELRRQSIIGSSLEASVALFVFDQSALWVLQEFGTEALCTCFVVSSVYVHDSENKMKSILSDLLGPYSSSRFEVAFPGNPQNVQFGCIVTFANGQKCPRCWKYHTENLDSDGHTSRCCARCRQILL